MSNYSIEEEIFKDIKGYEGYYQISNQGRVKSLGRVVAFCGDLQKKISIKILSINVNSVSGYGSVMLSMNGIKKRFTIHRLVAFTFLEYVEGKEVNHINGDKLDNRLENLEFVTKSENIRHAHKTGLINHIDVGNISVLQYDLEGNFIQEFPSILKATLYLGKHNGTSISKACRNLQKTAYGYKWKHKN